MRADPPCRVVSGLAPWGDRLRERAARGSGTGRVHVLVDVGVDGTAVDQAVRDTLEQAGRAVRRRTVAPEATLAEIVAEHGDIGPDDLVVGVGGGGVMDRAKLLALLASHPAAERRLGAPGRGGMVVLPHTLQRRPALDLVPTTIGTGSEASRSACLRTPGRKRLVFGPAVRADTAVHAPEATDTLPPGTAVEGILEAFLRLTCCYVGNHADLPGPDAAVERYATRLLALGDEARAAQLAGSGVPRTVRLAAASLSAASHADELLLGRRPYGDVSWPLANELSVAAGIRKLPALAAVTPPVWRRVAAGDERLGSARRLSHLWRVVRTGAGAALPAAADEGLRTLCHRWGIGGWPTHDAVEPDDLARRATAAWGRGLPMLRGLSVTDVSPLYGEALHLGTGAVPTSEERRTSNA